MTSHFAAGLKAVAAEFPGVSATVNMEHIKRHYYESHRTINPTGIVPIGPAPDFLQPHRRDALVVSRS